jgi:hypothetical protein
MPVSSRFPLLIEQLNSLVDKGIFSDLHNIIVVWGPLGKGKTTLMMQMLHRIYPDWEKVLSFILEPHICLSCGHSWDAGKPYVYEIPCEKCSKETKTQSLKEAIEAVYAKKMVIPFPFDYETGFIKKFSEGTTFSINSSKARGKITQKYPYMNYTFLEFRSALANAVELHIRVPMLGWDDIAVYFHRSNIQYMHPDVKNFFSRYNFVRKYIGNVVITVPTINFVPLQLMPFCTADVWVTERGTADFDVNKEIRSFFGNVKTWTKHYDGRDVGWEKVPPEWFAAYEEVRHAHAVEAFEHPEEVFVTTMPKAKEFTEEESLF